MDQIAIAVATRKAIWHGLHKMSRKSKIVHEVNAIAQMGA